MAGPVSPEVGCPRGGAVGTGCLVTWANTFLSEASSLDNSKELGSLWREPASRWPPDSPLKVPSPGP